MKRVKKLLAVVLAVVLASLTTLPTLFAEGANAVPGTTVPNVYVSGQGTDILDASGKIVYNDKFDDSDYVVTAIKECMPSYLEAVAKDTDEAWDAYNAALDEWVISGFDDFFLDKNGEASNGTHVCWSVPSSVRNTNNGNGYGIEDYHFLQDWRLDPIYNAGILSEYIDVVKKATGADKVNLIGRCEGANIVLSYLSEYAYKDDVNCVEFYVQSGNGVDAVSALFSGNIVIDSESLTRFKEQALELDNKAVVDLLDSFVEFAQDTYLLDVSTASLTLILRKTYDKAISRVIRETYGTLPGIWSLVTQGEYQMARKGIFKGYEEEYAGLLEKLDNYDTKIRQRVNEIILEAIDRGVKVANFPKYGEYQLYPFTATNNEYSDGTVSLKYASLGATVSKHGKQLSSSYIAAAKKNGTDKYISPDKVVDASTCLLPDTTWFVFNSEHREFPPAIDNYMLRFLRANGEMTVFDDPTMPQFLFCVNDYDDDTEVIPMTSENGAQTEDPRPTPSQVNWKDMIINFFKSILNFFKYFLSTRNK